MPNINLTLKVSTAWWLKPYCYAMVTLYALAGREPTQEKLTEWVMRGVKIEVES